PANGSSSRSLGFARDFACGLPLSRYAGSLTPANGSSSRSLDFARDFACRLPLSRYAGSLTPANGSNYKTLPSQNLGCWITTGGGLCIQPLTEKSLITRWSGGIMNVVL